MKIVHITPGSGGTFYCQNCFRDNELVKALQALDHDVFNVPMYLPLNLDKGIRKGNTPVFYGAINVYLKEKFSLFRHAPEWLERFFDSDFLLKYAAKKSGTTKAEGLEEMTLSMLHGEEGRQASELERLILFLKHEIQPDIVHLSNALLLGLAKRLKKDLGAKIICSLQDENEWIDPMRKDYQEKVWELMAERAADVDLFISASEFYKAKVMPLLQISPQKIRVVMTGINLDGYQNSDIPMNPPVLGYLCRQNRNLGLDILVDAFIHLKTSTSFKDLKLHITGGHTADDDDFIFKIKDKINRFGLAKDVRFFEDFGLTERVEFLKNLTLMSVPVPLGESFGAYQVEALASAVPVVQPKVGCFPEFVELTGGGVIYTPNDGQTLAGEIARLLENPERIRDLGLKGKMAVREQFTLDRMARQTLEVYEEALGGNGIQKHLSFL